MTAIRQLQNSQHQQSNQYSTIFEGHFDLENMG